MLIFNLLSMFLNFFCVLIISSFECLIHFFLSAEFNSMVSRIANLTKQNLDSLKLESATWGGQFKQAMNVNGGDIENATNLDYVMHFLTFFWKVSFITSRCYVAIGGDVFILSLGDEVLFAATRLLNASVRAQREGKRKNKIKILFFSFLFFLESFLFFVLILFIGLFRLLSTLLLQRHIFLISVFCNQL